MSDHRQESVGRILSRAKNYIGENTPGTIDGSIVVFLQTTDVTLKELEDFMSDSTDSVTAMKRIGQIIKTKVYNF